MFGGSVRAGLSDPDRPVNAKSVRGHLRFWWRTCNAGRFSDAAKMFEEEEKIWGSTDIPSAVDVRVNIADFGKPVACAHYRYNANRQRYASVPAFGRGYPAHSRVTHPPAAAGVM